MKEQLNKDFTKLDKINTKLLLSSVSKDVTGRQLQGVCHVKSLEALVATNGHVLTALKSRYSSELADNIIDIKYGGALINGKYPKVTNSIPTWFKFKQVFNIKKTHYFKARTYGAPEKAHFYMDGSISINDIIPNKTLAFTVNAEFLRHLVDNDWSIRWNDSNSPIQISLSRYNDFDGDFHIIMPLKL